MITKSQTILMQRVHKITSRRKEILLCAKLRREKPTMNGSRFVKATNITEPFHLAVLLNSSCWMKDWKAKPYRRKEYRTRSISWLIGACSEKSNSIGLKLS